MKISLITTERNEVESIKSFLDSALAQSLKANEIIIADGGSNDGTIEIIKEYAKKYKQIKLIIAPGNRSVGRNAATRSAKNEIIACTDVGSRLDTDWLKNITKPYIDNKNAMVVAGFFKPDPKTFFERVSSALMLNPNEKIDLNTWLPSSRSISYKKEAWKRAGGYPEYTNFNEDTPFDLALKKAGYKFENGLSAVAWWRPRPNIGEFYSQYYYYAVGDGIDGIDKEKIIFLSLRYAILLLMIPLFAYVSLYLSLLPILYLTLRPFKRTYVAWIKVKGIKAWLLMSLLITVYDFSQIFGFWYGYLHKKRLKNSKQLVR